jgi:hypothetical protein
MYFIVYISCMDLIDFLRSSHCISEEKLFLLSVSCGIMRDQVSDQRRMRHRELSLL